MFELEDIFADPSTTVVFVSASAALLIVCALAALAILVGSRRRTPAARRDGALRTVRAAGDLRRAAWRVAPRRAREEGISQVATVVTVVAAGRAGRLAFGHFPPA